MQAYIGKAGKTYGPYPVEKVREYVEMGNFALDDLACLDGKNWVKLAEALDATPPPKPAETPADKALENEAEEELVKASEPEAGELDLEFGKREPLFAAPLMSLWLLLGFLFCALAFAALFFPWYSFTGSGGENEASVWKNGLSKACSHLGLVSLIGIVLSVCGAFFKPLVLYSPLPMGVAALGALLPLLVLNTGSVNIVGTTLSISVGWGLWVCFGASLTATAFLYLNVLFTPREPSLGHS